MSDNKCGSNRCYNGVCATCAHDDKQGECPPCGSDCQLTCAWTAILPTPRDPLIGELVEVVKLLVADYDNARGWRCALGGVADYPDSQQITLARAIIKKTEES